MIRAEVIGGKIYEALKKFPERIVPYVIGYLLRQYKRYGLADLVEAGWDWRGSDE